MTIKERMIVDDGLRNYIGSLEQDEILPKSVWKEWIAEEEADHAAHDERYVKFTAEEIEEIIEILAADGYVSEN